MLTRSRNRRESSTQSDKTAESFSSQQCRICLKEGYIPIFGDDDISTEVMEFGCIEIAYLDNLPQYICNPCHALLEAAVLFRKTAQQSDKILKKIDYLEEENSDFAEDQDYQDDFKDEDQQYDTENESYIKREYLEYENSSESDLEIGWNYESENEGLSNITKSDPDYEDTSIDRNVEMQLVQVKQKADSNNDAENDLVMIIVSDKDKKKKTSFDCEKCKLAFQTKTELEIHNNNNHVITVELKKCEICSKSVATNNYQVHLKEHRTKYKKDLDKKQAKVECETCGKKVSKSYYKHHMKMHGTVDQQAERFIKCTTCNKLISAHYYMEHVKRMHELKTKSKKINKKEIQKNQQSLKCPVCDKMVEEDNYKDHLAKHGCAKKHLICDQCGKEFKYASAFKTHTLTHGSELKYQCQFCPYRGLHLGLLKVHVRTHTGDYNYKCTECSAQFLTKSNLSRHIERKHNDVCKHKCDICNRGFHLKRDVDKHVNTVHLRLKNHVCDICGKGFGHRDNMLSHQLKIHKREKITNRKGRMPSYLKKEIKSKDIITK